VSIDGTGVESGLAAVAGTSGSNSGGSHRSAGSNASSRSTSFNLPDEARRGIRNADGERGEEVEEDEEMDEEGTFCFIQDHLLMFFLLHLSLLAAAKHAAFIRARGRHYSNEAEAMKVWYTTLTR
jgi:protein phosphatase inhibitor 2